MARIKQRKQSIKTPKLDQRKQSATASKRDVLPFEKLAPEMRNIIYEYALVHDGSVHITQHSLTRRLQAKIKAITYRGPRGGIKTRLVVLSRWKGVGILFVNKAIYREARPVLYGQNTFAFQGQAPLRDFMLRAAKGAQLLLRSVRLLEVAPYSFPTSAMVPLLRPARNLAMLELGGPHLVQEHVLAAVRAFVGLPGDRACKLARLGMMRLLSARVPDSSSVWGQYCEVGDGRGGDERLAEMLERVKTKVKKDAGLLEMEEA